LDSNLIVGNWTALGSTLALSSTLAHIDLRLNELTGSVVIELCESIGDGILHVDCGIECECCNHEELCEDGECVDVPGWHDSVGDEYDCGCDCMCWNRFIVLITLTLNINWNIDSVGAMSSNQCFLIKFDRTWIIT